MPETTDQLKQLALRSIRVMEAGTREDFEEVLHSDFLNHEANDEPPASRGRGPAAAFAGLRWEIHEVVGEGDLAAVHCTMSGRHVRTFVGYDENARVKEAFPATGKRFATTQTHWLRIADGKVIEHWANRERPGHGLPAWLGTAVAAVPVALGGGEVVGAEGRSA